MAFSGLASTRAQGVIERFLTEGDALVADGGEIRDPSYRVNVSAAGIHVYNRDGMTTATDRFDLYPGLDLLQGQKRKNTPHAFYLGVELGRAQIAWQLGKRYVRDEPLKWGCAMRPATAQDTASPHAYKPEGTTLKAGKRKREVP